MRQRGRNALRLGGGRSFFVVNGSSDVARVKANARPKQEKFDKSFKRIGGAYPAYPAYPHFRATQKSSKSRSEDELPLGRPWPDHYVGVNKRFLTDLFASMLAQAEGFTSSSEPPSPRATVAQHVEVRYPPSSLSFTWKARPVEAQDLKSGTSEWSFSVDLMLSKKHSRSTCHFLSFVRNSK